MEAHGGTVKYNRAEQSRKAGPSQLPK